MMSLYGWLPGPMFLPWGLCLVGRGSLSGGRPPQTVDEQTVRILLECCLVADETGLHLPDYVISDKGRREVNYHH